jgi:hypothetical protein
VELLKLTVDGAAVETRLVETKGERKGVAVKDRYHISQIASPKPGRHTAEARVRVIATGEEYSQPVEFQT